jgi:hypothetical protein
MTIEASQRIANLEFFNSAVLFPIGQSVNAHSTGLLAASARLIEVTSWLRLGMAANYFETAAATKIVSTMAEQIIDARSNLLKAEVIPAGDRRYDYLVKDGKEIDMELFIPPWKFDVSKSDATYRFLQTCFLLTAEALPDDETTYFQESIAWTSGEEWELRQHQDPALDYNDSLAKLHRGFASNLRYLEGLNQAYEDYLLQADRPVGRYAHIRIAPEIIIIQQTAEIRFNFRRPYLSLRYVKFASTLVNSIRLNSASDSVAGIDFRRDVFAHLFSMIISYSFLSNERKAARKAELWFEYIAPDGFGKEVEIDSRPWKAPQFAQERSEIEEYKKQLRPKRTRKLPTTP